MKSSTERAVDELIESLSKADGDDFERAREMLAPAHLDILNELAVAALVSAARQARRRVTLGAERRASQPIAKPRTPEEQTRIDDREARWAREDEEMARRHNERMSRLIEDFADSVRVAWTAELLGSAFTMKDGRVVTWGEATIEDHEERSKMFAGMARAGVEGASRHEQALRSLRAKGVENLSALVMVAA